MTARLCFGKREKELRPAKTMSSAHTQRSSRSAPSLPRAWRAGIDLLRGRGRDAPDPRIARRDAAHEAELQHAADQLYASRARIVAIGARERRRIERDLHDSGQNRLVALRIKLELAAEEAQRAGQPALHTTLVELRDEAQEALDAVRSIAHGIYPPLLATNGLGPALSAELADSALPVRVEGGGDLPRSGPEAESAVYHCCLEAVQNACKHAGPRATLTIPLAWDDGVLRFEVLDDGVGLPPRVAHDARRFTHMRDRVAAVGGQVEIDGSPGEGTRVRGVVPWPRRSSGERGEALDNGAPALDRAAAPGARYHGDFL
jgi:signal transduction histidine kinase